MHRDRVHVSTYSRPGCDGFHWRVCLQRSVWSFLLGGVLWGCSGDAAGPTAPVAAQTFWTLVLSQHAINLAVTPPYDTIRLSATALTATGTPLSTAGLVTYRSLDSTVTVDTTGLVTAHYVTGETQVIASRTVQGVTLADTADIQVTQTPFPAPLATFSIQPQPDGLDSAKISVDQYFAVNEFNGNIPVYATIATSDATTDTVCNVNGCALKTYFSLSETGIVTIDRATGTINNALRPGKVTIYATTWAYGVAKRDSLPFIIGYPLTNFVALVNGMVTGSQGTPVAFAPPTVTIGVGGRVFFFDDRLEYNMADTIRVVFDDSTHIRGGADVFYDGPDLSQNFGYTAGIVRFPVAGTYPFHTDTRSASGTVVVSSGP